MNFRELRNRLISSLWDYIGCPVILSNQVQPEAEPPFCIYTVTVPYIPDGGMGDYEIADVAEGVKISRMEMPSATFSFTFCSQNRTAYQCLYHRILARCDQIRHTDQLF